MPVTGAVLSATLAITGMKAGGAASIVSTTTGHRAAITRRIGGAKGERGYCCKRACGVKPTCAVAIHRRGTDGRGITVKIVLIVAPASPRPFSGRRIARR